MDDPGTWTTVWESVGARDGMSRGGQEGKNWDNCLRIQLKHHLKKTAQQKMKERLKPEVSLVTQLQLLLGGRPVSKSDLLCDRDTS